MYNVEITKNGIFVVLLTVSFEYLDEVIRKHHAFGYGVSVIPK